MGLTACTEPQCLYKGALYLTVELYLYSHYGPYGLYRASVPVQGCNLPYSTAIPLLPLWAVRPVQSLSAYKGWTLPLPLHSVHSVFLTLDNDQLDAQIFNTFITILYVYMFRAISCSSSGGQIVLIQHLVSSLSVSDRPVHTLRENSQPVHRTVTYRDNSLIYRVTIADAVLIQFDLLRIRMRMIESC